MDNITFKKELARVECLIAIKSHGIEGLSEEKII